MEDGVLANNEIDKANLLNNHFTYQTIPPNSDIPLTIFEYLMVAQIDNIVITPAIVRKVPNLQNLDPSKACEPDSIGNRVLK